MMLRAAPVVRAAATIAAAVLFVGSGLSAQNVGFNQSRWRLVGQKARVNVYTQRNYDPDMRLYKREGAPQLGQMVEYSWKPDFEGFKLLARPKRDPGSRNRVTLTFSEPGLYILAWRSGPEQPRYS
ncbi:MAG: hypothetical protein ACE5R4_18370, partial [Armatimonadota bacterium]